VWRLFRELRLTRSQRAEIRGLFHEVRAALRELRGDLPGEVALLLGRDTFDRGAAERVAETRLARLEQGKVLVLDALGRLRALLTPAQRAKVLAFAAA
jgi:Spy/CpxP family protein refolding chaperone